MTRFLKIALPLCFVLFVSCWQSKEKKYEQKVENVKDHEKNNPKQFVKVSAQYKKGLTGKFSLEGTIANSATLSDYKDVELKIIYYSKTHTKIEEDKLMIYENIPHGGQISFKEKLEAPTGTETLSYEFSGATAN